MLLDDILAKKLAFSNEKSVLALVSGNGGISGYWCADGTVFSSMTHICFIAIII